MSPEEFVDKHPRLFHMATKDALPQIQAYGLLSTIAVLDMLEVDSELKRRLIEERRPKSVELRDEKLGRFTLRDQIPMRDGALTRCLQGMTPQAWYRTLNERVFMWASKERVETLLNARAYRGKDHLVLTIDTQKIVELHASDIEASSINSGSTLYNPPLRGPKTFAPLADFETLNPKKKIVEVTIKHSIPLLEQCIVDATVRKG